MNRPPPFDGVYWAGVVVLSVGAVLAVLTGWPGGTLMLGSCAGLLVGVRVGYWAKSREGRQ